MSTVKILFTRNENIPNGIHELDVEDYLRGVVPVESLPNWHIEEYKAQAVAARTFTYINMARPRQSAYDMDDTTKYQAYKINRETPITDQAVLETKDEVLFYDGALLKSLAYTSSNGGRTVSSEDRWGGYYPYLISKIDNFDAMTNRPLVGHGVGMSQFGAQEMAKLGYSYKEILAFYYPGTNITTMGDDMNVYKIAIDAGHGTNTDGKYSAKLTEDLYINGELVRAKGERIKEYEFNSATREKLKTILLSLGFEVFTMDNGLDIPLSERKKLIKAANCDFSISIHYNADGNGSSFTTANGLSAFVDDESPSGFSKEYNDKLLVRLSEIKGQRIRGNSSANFAMTNENDLNCYAVLVEHGFMTNKTECSYMLDEDFQHACAIAHAKTICEMFKIGYESGEAEMPEETSDNYKGYYYTVSNPYNNTLAMYNASQGSVVGSLENDTIVVPVGEAIEGYVPFVYMLDIRWIREKYLTKHEVEVIEEPIEEEPIDNPIDTSELQELQELVIDLQDEIERLNDIIENIKEIVNA